jgi:hypothetical protein
MTVPLMTNTQASANLTKELTPTRSLLFYTLTATIPIVAITLVLLFMSGMSRKNLALLSVLGAITGLVGLGRLLYEMTLDIAGFPDYKLPIWSVFFLIVYLVSGFSFLFFGYHMAVPGKYFGGFSEGAKEGFLDSVYLSLCNYIGASPFGTISVKSQGMRFATVIQGVVSLFINVVIITKFVNSF